MSSIEKRKICVVLVDRANYGRMKPVMRAVQNHPSLELQTICTGTMLLERFGSAVDLVASDGFNVDSKVYIEVEGSVPATMAKSVGFAVIEFATELRRLHPDLVLLIGDRYEALAAAMATAYQNICLAHIQGGEVSGGVDESARHAITKFAHYHFPATERAAEYIVRMGENPETVFCVGCPCGDSILAMNTTLPQQTFLDQGVGAPIDLSRPYFLVIYHPVTTQYESEQKQVEEVLGALHELRHSTIWLWPNIDAGSNRINKALRVYREHHHDNAWLHMLKNLPPEFFQQLLYHATCAIGNSSSFVRDSSFSGTPVVLVGSRQAGREYAENVLPVACEKKAIHTAIEQQCRHGRYPPSTLYGRGTAAEQIAQYLSSVTPYRQKSLHYIREEEREASCRSV